MNFFFGVCPIDFALPFWWWNTVGPASVRTAGVPESLHLRGLTRSGCSLPCVPESISAWSKNGNSLPENWQTAYIRQNPQKLLRVHQTFQAVGCMLKFVGQYTGILHLSSLTTELMFCLVDSGCPAGQSLTRILPRSTDCRGPVDKGRAAHSEEWAALVLDGPFLREEKLDGPPRRIEVFVRLSG